MTKKDILKEIKASCVAIKPQKLRSTLLKRWKKSNKPCHWCGLEWPKKHLLFSFTIPSKTSMREFTFCSATCVLDFTKKHYGNYLKPHPPKRGSDITEGG